MKQVLLLFSLSVILNTAVFSQSDVKSLTDLGNDLVELKRYEEACEKYEKAIEIYPEIPSTCGGRHASQEWSHYLS